MRPNAQFPADLVIFTEKIFNKKLHVLCSLYYEAKSYLCALSALNSEAHIVPCQTSVMELFCENS